MLSGIQAGEAHWKSAAEQHTTAMANVRSVPTVAIVDVLDAAVILGVFRSAILLGAGSILIATTAIVLGAAVTGPSLIAATGIVLSAAVIGPSLIAAAEHVSHLAHADDKQGRHQDGNGGIAQRPLPEVAHHLVLSHPA